MNEQAGSGTAPAHDPLEDGDDDTTTAHAGPPLSTADEAALDAESGTATTREEPVEIPRSLDEPSEKTLRPNIAPVSLSSASLMTPSTMPSPRTSSIPPPPPSRKPPPPVDLTDDLEEDDDLPEPREDSVATLNPSLGLAVPGSVEIRTVEYDNDETETEVRTAPQLPRSQVPSTEKLLSSSTSPRPAAGVPVSETQRATLPDLEQTQLSADDDDGTTQARRLPVSLDEAESITTKGPMPPSAAPSTYEEDSVTTRAPQVTAEQVEAVLAGESKRRPSDPETLEGPTNRVRKMPPAAGQPPPSRAPSVKATAVSPVMPTLPTSPADSEPESITTQAPAPLTNMLRVIASDVPGNDDDDDEEENENRTEVMPNAPLKRLVDEAPPGPPSIRPTRPMPLPNAGPVAARQLSPGSESGLRSSRPSSGIALASNAHDARAFAQTETFQATPMPGHLLTPPPMHAPSMQPIAHDVPPAKGPRYGLLVGIVAFVSFAVPAFLYFGLRHGGAPPPGSPAAPSSDVVSHDETTRGKDNKKAPPSAPSASASASASASPSASASSRSTKRH